jgi:hypothetical protein
LYTHHLGTWELQLRTCERKPFFTLQVANLRKKDEDALSFAFVGEE